MRFLFYRSLKFNLFILRRVFIRTIVLLFALSQLLGAGAPSKKNGDANPVPRHPVNVLTHLIPQFVPKGDHPGAIGADCDIAGHVETLESMEIPSQERWLAQFFKRCGDRLSRFQTLRLFQEFRLSRVNYDLHKHPYFKRESFDLSSGRSEVLLGVNPKAGRAPLVVIICGMTCGLSSPAIRVLASQIFDSGLFHVAFIESVTSSDWIRRNRKLQLGGYDESKVVLEVLSRLQKGLEAIHFSEYHIAGLSLGGHAALFSALRAPSPLEVSSVLALCPAVDIKTTLENADRHFETRLFFGTTLKKQIYENFSEIAWPEGSPARESLRHIKKGNLLNYLDTSLSPFLESNASNHESAFENLMARNRFQDVSQGVTLPIFVIGAKNDSVVPSAINFTPLKNSLGGANHHPKNWGLLELEKGGHCAQSVVYGWRTFNQVLTSLLVSRSRSLQGKLQTFRLGLKGLPSLSEGRLYFPGRWRLSRDGELATYSLPIFEPGRRDSQNGPLCANRDPEGLSELCFSKVEFTATRKAFGWFERLDRPVLQQAFVRWLNVNVQPVDEQGQPVGGTFSPPVALQWRALNR